MKSAMSISVPQLEKGQLVSEWSQNYIAATVGLADAQKCQLLPLYIARTPGEKAIAQLVSSKTDYATAIKEVIDLIDGEQSVIQLHRAYYDIQAPVKGDCTTVFFQLLSTGKAATIPMDVVFNRFLTFFKEGDQFHTDNSTDIKGEMTEETMLKLFRKFKTKQDKKSKPMVVKQESCEEAYPVSVVNVGEKPEWCTQVQEVQDGLDDLRHLVKETLNHRSRYYEEDPEVQDDPEEGYYYNKPRYNNQAPKRGNGRFDNSRKACTICKRTNHSAATCFKRQCEKCKGTGHSEQECPSYSKSRYSRDNSSSNSSSRGNGRSA